MGRRRGTSISAEVMPKARMKGREGNGVRQLHRRLEQRRGEASVDAKKMEKGGWLWFL
jgi:hypothetical protein